jgi:hypothetical protein
MVIEKNAKPKPKCQAMCLVTSSKISEPLDKKQAFHKGISKARTNKHMYSNILAQINFSARHNFGNYDDKKVDKTRITMQKIGVNLDEFSILYDFSKLMEKMKIKNEHSIKNGRENVKWHGI